MERLKSRKLWVTIIAGVLLGIAKIAKLPVPEGMITLVVTYIAGQSAVDIANAIAKRKEQ